MLRFRKNERTEGLGTFGDVRPGQSFTTDGEVWLCIGNRHGNIGNAVRISAEAAPRNPRFRTFGQNDRVWNINMYHLVHESRLGDLA